MAVLSRVFACRAAWQTLMLQLHRNVRNCPTLSARLLSNHVFYMGMRLPLQRRPGARLDRLLTSQRKPATAGRVTDMLMFSSADNMLVVSWSSTVLLEDQVNLLLYAQTQETAKWLAWLGPTRTNRVGYMPLLTGQLHLIQIQNTLNTKLNTKLIAPLNTETIHCCLQRTTSLLPHQTPNFLCISEGNLMQWSVL